MSTDPCLDPIDRDALERCLAEVQRDPKLGPHFGELVAERGFVEAAKSACYRVQIKHLKLTPWEEPPMCIDEDDPHERAKGGQKLLRKMLARGLSRYEPSPEEALKKPKVAVDG